MRNFFIVKWLRNISIARKLYFTVGIMALLIATELLTLWFALNTLSAIRAYVGGEGLWSKAQKNAIYSLQKYGSTHDFDDYLSFKRYMQVPYGDSKTRLELAKEFPDLRIARQGFLEGRNHPQDIDRMIRLVRHFSHISYIEKALAIWAEADPIINQLVPISERLHKEIITVPVSQERINTILKEIDPINDKLSVLEDDFSFTLGEGSRWLENLILKLLFAVVLTVEICGLLLTISVSRGISKGLNEIIRASRVVATGDFKTRAKTFSTDEIGVLATSFNKMTDDLEQNVIARKEAEKKQIESEIMLHADQKVHLALEAAPNAMIMVDEAGKINLVNTQAEKLFGYNRKDLIGQFIDILVPARFREKYPEYIRTYFANPSPRGMGIGLDFFGVDINGKEFPAEVGLNPITTEEGPMVLASIIDITERRTNERTLKEAKEKAEQSSRAKQEFLSIMSHEIRTPLNAVLGVTQLLMEENPKKSQVEPLNILKFSANNLLSLINNILDFSKIEAGKIQFEKINFNLHHLIHEVIESFALTAKEKSLPVHSFYEKDIPEFIIGDPTRLTQILNNLLHNAIKFTEKGGVSLNVRLQSSSEKEVNLLFEVSDTGVGIPADRQKEIFDAFTQEHSSIHRRYGGSGLGLAISKRLVEMLGGKIDVESETGKGSVFRFDVTFTKGKEMVPGEIERIAHPDNRGLKGIEILLVEDNIPNMTLTKKLISKWGAEVDCAENGLQAVNKIKQKKYDLVLMDLQMPVMDGFEANKEIKRMGFSAQQLPVIALTAFATSDDKSNVLAEGMSDFISKPIDTYELYRKIIKHTHLGKSRLADAGDNAAETEEPVTINRMIESFRDDPEFINDYLNIFEQEFNALPSAVHQILLKRDADALSKLIHKVTPSLMRFANHDYIERINSLMAAINPDNPDDEKIKQSETIIRNLSDDVVAQIASLRKRYVV
ncbi:MAG TPA: ATP-binding protein [Bacteroidia bacterium]|nr:ATP-binding protein [Bacteroidia bacterium]